MRVNRENLLKQLEAVSPGLSTKEILEQSSCLIFKGGEVMTYNDEVACRAKCSLTGIEGAVVAKPLLAILAKLPEDDLDLEVGEGVLIIKGKGRQSKIAMEAEVLLPIENIEEPGEWKKLPPDFGEAVGIVAPCAGKDESQFVLTCIHWTSTFLEACDNYQLTRWPTDTPLEQDVLLRREAMAHLKSLDVMEFSETEAWVHFRNEAGLVISCRRYTEDYPDFDEHIKVEGTKTSLPGGLGEAVERAEIFSSDNVATDTVRVDFKEGRLRLTGEGAAGSHQEMKKVKYDGPPLSFRIAPAILRDIAARKQTCEIATGKLKIDGGKYVYIGCLIEED